MHPIPPPISVSVQKFQAVLYSWHNRHHHLFISFIIIVKKKGCRFVRKEKKVGKSRVCLLKLSLRRWERKKMVFACLCVCVVCCEAVICSCKSFHSFHFVTPFPSQSLPLPVHFPCVPFPFPFPYPTARSVTNRGKSKELNLQKNTKAILCAKCIKTN